MHVFKDHADHLFHGRCPESNFRSRIIGNRSNRQSREEGVALLWLNVEVVNGHKG